MTDQIPANLTPEEVEAAREWATSYINGFYKPGHVDAAARALTALLPAPPRPTLADMTSKARRACRWMQADVANHSVRYVIAAPTDESDDEDLAVLIDSDGAVDWVSPGRVTPRPDLPRLEWQCDKKHEPAPALPEGWRLADHQKYGRVIVTNPTPDSDGRVYYVRPSDGIIGNACDLCSPSELTYIDAEPGEAPVPPNTVAVGSVWGDADALTAACRESGRDQIAVTDKDGDVSAWASNAKYWHGPHPIPQYAPYTIIHTGKKAHQ